MERMRGRELSFVNQMFGERRGTRNYYKITDKKTGKVVAQGGRRDHVEVIPGSNVLIARNIDIGTGDKTFSADEVQVTGDIKVAGSGQIQNR